MAIAGTKSQIGGVAEHQKVVLTRISVSCDFIGVFILTLPKEAITIPLIHAIGNRVKRDIGVRTEDAALLILNYEHVAPLLVIMWPLCSVLIKCAD